jgi:multidrug resistance protein MdtO
MALSAADLFEHLELRPGKLEFAARLALICALTAVVAEIYQTPEPALAIYIAFFMNQKERVTSLIMSAALVVIITLIIALIFVIAIWTLDYPMWRTIAMALVSFCFLFLASASKFGEMGGITALIVAYGLDILGLAPAGEAGTRALLYAWLFIGMPAGVSIVVNLLFGRAPCRLAEEVLAWRLSVAAQMLRRPSEKTRRRLAEAIAEDVPPIEHWLHLAGVEKSTRPADLAALRQAADNTERLMIAVGTESHYEAAALPQTLRDRIAQTLEAMARVLERGGYPVEIEWEALAHDPPLKPMAVLVAAEIGKALTHFAEPVSLPAATEEPAKGGFLLADAFRNPDHVRYALKATCAAMFCYVLYTLLNWPGIHTCFLTVFIVSLTSTGETVEKLSLRLLGAAIGSGAGLAAIVFLLPHLTSIGALMIVVFMGAFVSAYIAGSSPRIAYAGFQMAFAFFLCVVQGSGPEFQLSIARDRVVGILVGNIVTYLVFTNVWPVSIAPRIDTALARILRGLARNASEMGAAIAAAGDDILLAHYEPARVRPSAEWLSLRGGVLGTLKSLQGPLLLAAGSAMAQALSARLDRIASIIEAKPSESESYGGGTPVGSEPLHAIIEAHLRQLEREAGAIAGERAT